MTISLTGFMGCGKSSVGRRLSSLLSCSYADLDKAIEEKEGRTVGDIFQEEGENAFREKEKEMLEELIRNRYRVISLGGGTPKTETCRKMIMEKTVCIYLEASPETLAEHMRHSYIKRPLLCDIPSGDPIAWKEAMIERIGTMMKQRKKLYSGIAAYTVCVDGKTVDEIVFEIVNLLNREF